MSYIIERDLVWWREEPVDVEWGLVDYLRTHWRGKISIICAKDFDNDRKACNWTREDSTKIEYIVGDLDNPKKKARIEELLCCGGIHIFSGIYGQHKKYIDMLRKKKNKDCIIISESPTKLEWGILKTLLKLLTSLKYRCLYKKYHKVVKCLFVMGENTRFLFSNYGWDSNKVFDFIYLPRVTKCICGIAEDRRVDYSHKALYIGRFSNKTKGIRTLMDALDTLHDIDWKVDFVGGYGEDKDSLIDWIDKHDNASFIGSWPANDVISKMKNYDFCIVPSLYDGWNMAPFQTIMAGIGCIVSDCAGSDELILNSKSGQVFHSGDTNQLSLILRKAFTSREILEKWKSNAINFQSRIESSTIGNYFVDAIRYSYGEVSERPMYPWRKE